MSVSYSTKTPPLTTLWGILPRRVVSLTQTILHSSLSLAPPGHGTSCRNWNLLTLNSSHIMSIFSNLLNKSSYKVENKQGFTDAEKAQIVSASISTATGENGPFKVIDFTMKNGAVLSGVLGKQSPVTADGPVADFSKIFLVRLRKPGDATVIERWQVEE